MAFASITLHITKSNGRVVRTRHIQVHRSFLQLVPYGLSPSLGWQDHGARFLRCAALNGKADFIKSHRGDQKLMNKSYTDLTAVQVVYSQVSSFRTQAFAGSSRACTNTMEENYIKTVRQANKSYSSLVGANAWRKKCLILNENRLKLS